MSNPTTQSAIATPLPTSSGTFKKFVIVTLCGLLLAFLGLEVMSLLAAQQTEQNRRAVGMAGGRCETERRVPKWLQVIAGEDFHSFMDQPVITSVRLNGARAGDAEVARLPYLPELHNLDLQDSQLTSAGLKPITAWKSLQTLSLANTKVTDVTPLAVLPNLRALQLNFSEVRNEHLAGLSQLPHLKELAVGYAQVTDQGVVEIAKCTGLEELNIAAANLGETGLTPLHALKQLKLLVLKDAKVHPADLKALREAMPDLEIVNP